MFMLFFRAVFEIGMVVGPHIGYFFQFMDMRRTESVEGYARLVSLILLVSYTLRIFYFFGEHFASILLVQSISGVIVHTSLLYYVLYLEDLQWPLEAPLAADISLDAFPHAYSAATGTTTPTTQVDLLVTSAPARTSGQGSTSSWIAVDSPSTPLDSDLLHPMDAAMFAAGHGNGADNTTLEAVENGEGAELIPLFSALDSRTEERLPTPALDGYRPLLPEESAVGLPPAVMTVGGPSSEEGRRGAEAGMNPLRELTHHSLDSAPRRAGAPFVSGAPVPAGALAGWMQRVLKVEAFLESKMHRVDPGWFVIRYVTLFATGCLFFPFYYVIARHVLHMSGAPFVGYTALGFEAMLVLPQVIKNARRQSTQGLERMLVAAWVVGDAIKMVYFLMMKQPLPFILCGAVQLWLDIVVVYQFFHYGDAPPVETRAEAIHESTADP